MRNLLVSEIFGPTWQGEGASAGQVCAFVRLGLCNLHCQWCDTAYTWRFNERFPHKDNFVYQKDEELLRLTPEDVATRVSRLRVNRVVISGGEPMMQQEGLSELISLLVDHTIEVETAGTIMPERYLQGRIHYNVSPKLAHSGNSKELRYHPDVLEELRDRLANFKFVVTRDTTDFDEVDQIVKEVSIPPEKVWIMPEGTNLVDLLQTALRVEEEVLNRRWNLTFRQQVLLHGKQRAY